MFYPVSFFTFFCIFSVVLLGASGVGGCVWQVVFSFFFLSRRSGGGDFSNIFFLGKNKKKCFCEIYPTQKKSIIFFFSPKLIKSKLTR